MGLGRHGRGQVPGQGLSGTKTPGPVNLLSRGSWEDAAVVVGAESTSCRWCLSHRGAGAARSPLGGDSLPQAPMVLKVIYAASTLDGT